MTSAPIVITSVLLHSFSLIVRHTFAITLKSSYWVGQVISGISFFYLLFIYSVIATESGNNRLQ